MNIALDAMGGDNAPEVIVRGALWAHSELGVNITLVGDENLIQRELSKGGGIGKGIQIHHCSQMVTMDESPLKVLRQKKDSSIMVAFDLVKGGQAEAVVSAGNSGATVGAAVLTLGRIKGVERPALAGIFPGARGKVVLIDVGANVDTRPKQLFEFGIMGDTFARSLLNMDNPKVGLLNIGQEGSKGNEQVRIAHDLFGKGPFNFVGNVEGRDIFSGDVQVIVSDGFVGNVAVKLTEGMAEAIGIMFEREISRSFFSKLGFWLSRKAFENLKRNLDYEEYGGALLMGIKGVGIICHGSSSPKAIKNAIRTAAGFVNNRVQQRLEEGLAKFQLKASEEIATV
ncbi:MAG: phosphate acyltransferase PlsX [Desulfobacterales bacterium]|nr:phosphate acyltransferase PlsX [Desulfobacterales bacterium]